MAFQFVCTTLVVDLGMAGKFMFWGVMSVAVFDTIGTMVCFPVALPKYFITVKLGSAKAFYWSGQVFYQSSILKGGTSCMMLM